MESQPFKLQDFMPDGEQVDQLIEQALDKGFLSEKGRLPRGEAERRHWLREENGARVLNAVPPVAFAVQICPGVDLDNPDSFLAQTVYFTPAVNPLFHALMVRLGASPNGPRTYEVSARKGKNAAERDQIVKNLKAILEVVPGAVCYPPDCVEQGEKKGFQSWNISRYKVFRDIYCLIRDTSAGERIERSTLHSITHDHPTDKSVSALENNGEDISGLSPLRGAAVIISAAKGRLFFRVCTNRPEGIGLFLGEDPAFPDLDRLRPAGRLEPCRVTPDVALGLAGRAKDLGYTVIDPQGAIGAISAQIAHRVIAQRIPGSPGQARLVVGQEVVGDLGGIEQSLPESTEGTPRVAIVPAGAAGRAVDLAAAQGNDSIIDSQVLDVIRMAGAPPAPPDPCEDELRLRLYQRQAVGVHAATQVGYLQACSVGLGKTAITLRGMQAHAAKGS